METGRRAVITLLYPLSTLILYVSPAVFSPPQNLIVSDHFHVHIVNSNYVGFKGVAAGQAHILEDVISLVF